MGASLGGIAADSPSSSEAHALAGPSRRRRIRGGLLGLAGCITVLALSAACGDSGISSNEVAITALAGTTGLEGDPSQSEASVLGSTTVLEASEAADSLSLPTYRRPAAVPEVSGCRPNSTNTLPDGRWFGFIRSSDESDIAFDLACLFTGDQASSAATADGLDVAEVEARGHYIRNDDTAERIVVIEPGVAIGEWLDDGSIVIANELFYPAWLAATPESQRSDMAVVLEVTSDRLRSVTPAPFQE